MGKEEPGTYKTGPRYSSSSGMSCLKTCKPARESDQNNPPAEMRRRTKENRTTICV